MKKCCKTIYLRKTIFAECYHPKQCPSILSYLMQFLVIHQMGLTIWDPNFIFHRHYYSNLELEVVISLENKRNSILTYKMKVSKLVKFLWSRTNNNNIHNFFRRHFWSILKWYTNVSVYTLNKIRGSGLRYISVSTIAMPS